MIAFRNAASAFVTANNTVTINKPTNTADNDILLATTISYDGDARPTLSAPDGSWTEIATATISTNFRTTCWWKRASSEGASYAFTKDGTAATSDLAGVIAAYSGCLTTATPIDAFSNEAYAVNDASLIAGNLNTTVDNAMCVFLGASQQSVVVTATIATWTERHDASGGADSGWHNQVYAAELLVASAGTVVDTTATMSTAVAAKHAFMVALKPNITGTIFKPKIIFVV